MKLDELEAIMAQKGTNSCYRPDDEQLYAIKDWDGSELVHQSKRDVINYVWIDLSDAAFYIGKAVNENNEDAAFEIAQKYLKRFSAIREEK